MCAWRGSWKDVEKDGRASVPSGQIGDVDGQPPASMKVEELDFAEEHARHRRQTESPGVRVSPEFETGKQQADPGFRRRSGKDRQLAEDVRSYGARHGDSDEAALGLRGGDLAGEPRKWALGGRGLPIRARAEPGDWMLRRGNRGGAGGNLARVQDEAELQAGGVVKDGVWWSGQGVRRRDREQMDVELHGGRGA